MLAQHCTIVGLASCVIALYTHYVDEDAHTLVIIRSDGGDIDADTTI